METKWYYHLVVISSLQAAELRGIADRMNSLVKVLSDVIDKTGLGNKYLSRSH